VVKENQAGQFETVTMAHPVEVLAPRVPEPYYSRSLRAQYRLDALNPAPVDPGSVAYAKVQYEVDERKYRARAEARLRAGGLQTEVPAGWPKVLKGPLVWSGSDFDDGNDEYVYTLTEADKAEIAAALKFFKGGWMSRSDGIATAVRIDEATEQGLDDHEITPDLFPLPTLGGRLERTAEDVYEGRGFAILRGLDPEVFSAEDLVVVCLGVSSYVAERRGKQDQGGSMLSQ
jgi:hypothetical protein